jgi:hypothetical protein
MGRQNWATRQGFFNGYCAPVNLSGRPRVLQLWEGEEEMRGRINRTEEPQRRRSPERGYCGGVRLQNRQGGGSSATKHEQEDNGEKAEVLCELWREENGCEERGPSVAIDPF